MFKTNCKKARLIAHAKKHTGGMYFNKRDSYAVLSDIICSMFLIIVLIITLLSSIRELGMIKSIKSSSILHFNEFYNHELGFIGARISGYKYRNQI